MLGGVNSMGRRGLERQVIADATEQVSEFALACTRVVGTAATLSRWYKRVRFPVRALIRRLNMLTDHDMVNRTAKSNRFRKEAEQCRNRFTSPILVQLYIQHRLRGHSRKASIDKVCERYNL